MLTIPVPSPLRTSGSRLEAIPTSRTIRGYGAWVDLFSAGKVPEDKITNDRLSVRPDDSRFSTQPNKSVSTLGNACGLDHGRPNGPIDGPVLNYFFLLV